MAVAEKATTQQRLEEAQARVGALQAEASGLPEAMRQALRNGDTDKYLRLMAREHAIPRDLESLEADVRSLRRQGMQERMAELAAAEPRLRAKNEETIRRTHEQIKAIEAEAATASSAYQANVQEWRSLEQELRLSGVVVS